MRNLRLLIAVLAFALCATQAAFAQTLPLSLFERYLEALRVQAGIPGISAAVIQDGAVVWERGLGRADVDQRIVPTPDTPFAIGGLSEALSATLLIRKCIDQSFLSTLDPVQQWVPTFPEPGTLVGHLLAHAAPGGGFRYDPIRFAALTPVIERCAGDAYRELLTREIFEPVAMFSSAPGAPLLTPLPEDALAFTPEQLARFVDLGRRMAVPYRVSGGRAARSDVPAPPIDAATGIITTVRDLERFDLALRNGFLLSPAARLASWTNVTSAGLPLPTGLGWFVQEYAGERIVWQFGLVKDAWSSMILKLPARDLTFILLANSDGLAAPFALENGDVTTSMFARLILKMVAP